MPKLNPEIFQLKNGLKISFRSFQPDDESSVQEFVKKVASESTHTLKYQSMPEILFEKYIALWEECSSHPVNINLGAFYNNELIGNLRFMQRNSNHPWIKHVGCFGMATRKDYWGQGLGTKMLQLMEAHAKTTEIKRIEAEVRSTNVRGVELYLKNGFKVEGLREKAAYIDDKYVDEYYIGKIIS